MRRRMKKPKELSIRKYVAAVGSLNNSLPVFPNGKELDKITPGEILEILEWSIPESWRTKFDLDGYVPTDFTKERFMTTVNRKYGCEKMLCKATALVQT
jgi:hypothetical protein